VAERSWGLNFLNAAKIARRGEQVFLFASSVPDLILNGDRLVLPYNGLFQQKGCSNYSTPEVDK
jgi:hypothetical protein